MNTSMLLAFLVICISYSFALKGDDCEGKQTINYPFEKIALYVESTLLENNFIYFIAVCVSVLNRFMETLSKDDKSNKDAIEKQFKKYCKDLKLKENRFCYYLGGTADAATGILGEMSKPMSWGMPADKICEKLKKKDKQVCELRYGKQL